VEGSLWVYGQTRLADYYAGDLTLRELLNRFTCLPSEAPIWHVLRVEHEQAEGKREVDEIEDLLSPFKPKE